MRYRRKLVYETQSFYRCFLPDRVETKNKDGLHNISGYTRIGFRLHKIMNLVKLYFREWRLTVQSLISIQNSSHINKQFIYPGSYSQIHSYTKKKTTGYSSKKAKLIHSRARTLWHVNEELLKILHPTKFPSYVSTALAILTYNTLYKRIFG